MKKYFSILILIIIIVPVVASASWWNPFSWNWKALFNEQKTEIISEGDKTIGAVVPTIDENKTKIEGVATKPTSPKKSTQTTETNVSDIVADYYQSTALTTNKSLEIVALISSESDRYIKGIPGNFIVLKSMVNTGFDAGVASEMVGLLDELSSSYISDFQKLKSNADSYSGQLKKQQSLLLSVSQDIRSKYIPISKNVLYTNEVQQYWSNIDQQVNSLEASLNALSAEYQKDKKVLGDAIYQGGIGNLQAQANSLRTISNYRPAIINVPIYTPPIRTYCNSFGDSFNCTSYSN